MSLPFTSLQCFVVVMLVSIVLGFQRGWRRELISLVAVLLGYFLVRPENSKAVGDFLIRLPSTLSYMFTGNTSGGTQVTSPIPGTATNTMAPFWSLLLFIGIVALGYYVSLKAFPKPSTPHERLIGIVPAVVSGGFIMAYLIGYFPSAASGKFNVAIQPPNPSDYIPVFFFIVIVTLVIALIVARTKKAAPKK